MADLEKTGKEFNRAGTDFLKVDVATALTFAHNALTADDPFKKARNQKSARKAYDTVLRMSQKISLTDEDANELKAGLQQLKANLAKLGEVF